MNIKKIFIWSSVGILLISFIFTRKILGATIITNGSFEIRDDGRNLVSQGNITIDGWTVDSGSVELVGSYWQASDGLLSIDMDGNEPGSISQTFPTDVGATYNVSFDLSGNPDNGPSDKDLRVTASGSEPEDYHYDTSIEGNTDTANGAISDMKWQRNIYTFTATYTNTTLTFSSQTDAAWGPALDNVVVEVENPSTPIPTVTPTSTPTATPTPTVTPTPTPTLTPTPTVSPTPSPTGTPIPTVKPSPTIKPTTTPTQKPSSGTKIDVIKLCITKIILAIFKYF